MNVEVKGERETRNALGSLDNKVQRKYVRKALRAAARPVLSEARATAPVLSGKLRRAIRIRSGRNRKGSISMLVSLGRKWFTGPTFYGGFVVFGHKLGKRPGGKAGKANDSRPAVPPNDWLQKSMESKSSAAVSAATESLKEQIAEGG